MASMSKLAEQTLVLPSKLPPWPDVLVSPQLDTGHYIFCSLIGLNHHFLDSISPHPAHFSLPLKENRFGSYPLSDWRSVRNVLTFYNLHFDIYKIEVVSPRIVWKLTEEVHAKGLAHTQEVEVTLKAFIYLPPPIYSHPHPTTVIHFLARHHYPLLTPSYGLGVRGNCIY